MRTIERIGDPEEAKLLIRKRKGKSFNVLLISDHDNWCKKILVQAEAWATRFPNSSTQLYIISSMDFPEIWGAYSITVAPALMKIKDGKVSILTEYKSIYDYFNEN